MALSPAETVQELAVRPPLRCRLHEQGLVIDSYLDQVVKSG